MSSDDNGHGYEPFLAAFAAILLENVLRLDDTVGRVTDLVTGLGRPSREMVLTLQKFDKLKQEFDALGGVMTRYAEVANVSALSAEDRAKFEQSMIASITVADLQARFQRELEDDLPEIPAPPLAELLKQVDVDIEY